MKSRLRIIAYKIGIARKWVQPLRLAKHDKFHRVFVGTCFAAARWHGDDFLNDVHGEPDFIDGSERDE